MKLLETLTPQLQKTLGLSPTDTPTIRTYNHRGDFYNLIYLPSIGWISVPSFRSISDAKKFVINQLNQYKDKPMTENTITEDEKYIITLESIQQQIENMTDDELNDLYQKVNQSDFEDSIKDELLILIDAEFNERQPLKEEYVFNLTSMAKQTFNELFFETKKEIQNTNVSDFAKQQILKLLEHKIKNLTSIQIDESFSYGIDEGIETINEIEVIEENTEKNTELKYLYIEALSNIQPYEKIDTNTTLDNIIQQISENGDVLLKSKVDIYIKSQSKNKEIVEQLRKKETTLPNIKLDETLLKPINETELTVIQPLLMEEVENEFRDKNIKVNNQYFTDFQIIENLKEGYQLFDEILEYINDKTSLNLRDKILSEVSNNPSKIENLNVFDKFMISQMIGIK